MAFRERIRLARAEARLRGAGPKRHPEHPQQLQCELEEAIKAAETAERRAAADVRIRAEKAETEAKLEAERKSWR